MQDDSDTERASSLIEGGAELAGASVGAAVGLIGGPPGALAGAAAGVGATRVFKKLGAELSQRLLAPRQRVRVGAAFAVAGADIAARMDRGEVPRSDGFFESSETTRSAAEELLEGVLQAAGDSYEEAKVPLLGHLYASLAFDSSVDRAYANWLIRLMESRSYRQLVAMALIWEKDAEHMVDEAAQSEPPRTVVFDDELALEIDELERSGLVGRGPPGGTPKRGGATFTDAGNLPITLLTLTRPGRQLYELANLRSIPEEPRADLRRHLIMVLPG